MVQRGYWPSISVLLAAFSLANRAFSCEYFRTCISGQFSHRSLLTSFETLPFVPSLRHTTKEPSLPVGVGLALGGGFARGYAHLGVLLTLEENEIPISSIAGSSIGSILGAAYASGAPLDRIIAKCSEIRFRDFARWRVSRFGLASNDRLGPLVERFFHSKQFEDLLIPTAIVATDLGSGNPVVFRQGALSDAIRASCAFPGLFEPVQLGTRCLADVTAIAAHPPTFFRS
jgi:NTE family protein